MRRAKLTPLALLVAFMTALIIVGLGLAVYGFIRNWPQ